MTDQPWQGDACSLVDAFRKGDISPSEALELSLSAIERSELNAFSHVATDEARVQATKADVTLPFGGVPLGVKELDIVKGWPNTEASLVFADRIATRSSTMVTRLAGAGAVFAAQTTASEFGGVNYTHTRLHGSTRNPWNPERTPGGSSGGSAAAVSGGILTLATAGDGGGSIRIPAGFTGTFGLKSTFGRIPRGPHTHHTPLTVVFGCISRSVRDTARWFDVCNGFDAGDTLSLPRVSGWERDLGTHIDALRGKRAAIVVDIGDAIVRPEVVDRVLAGAEALIADVGLKKVDLVLKVPEAGFEWAMGNLVTLIGDLGDLYPACEELFTPEIQFAVNIAFGRFDLKMAGANEMFRVALNEVMAETFADVEFIFAATNPDVAFNAAGPMATTVGDRDLIAEFGFERALGNNGALTMPANLSGNPAVSIPVDTLDGLPVGMQIIGRHHEEQLLLDLALVAERERPWPLVAPGSPH
jgi:Asp-tRNA(Asn)/Glu-tRNA(Gln) amidotransferase A subunit family amidase